MCGRHSIVQSPREGHRLNLRIFWKRAIYPTKVRRGHSYRTAPCKGEFSSNNNASVNHEKSTQTFIRIHK